MRLTKKQLRIRTIAFLLIVVALTPYLIPVYKVSAQNGETEEEPDPIPPPNNQIDFNVWRTDLAQFEIYDNDLGSGSPIDTISSGDKWNDGNAHIYPGIQVWATQPFLCSPDGSDYYTPHQYIVSPENVFGFSFEDGTYKYMRAVNLGIDVAIRTYSWMPTPNYNHYLIQPLVGKSFSSDWGTGSCSVDDAWQMDGKEPYGVLVAEMDYGADTSCETVEWHVGPDPDLITNGQTVYPTQVPGAVGPLSLENYFDINQMYSNLVRRYGNSRLMVRPKIDFEALEGFISYDYHKDIDDNRFHIYSENTQMAIIDAYIAPAFQEAGKMETYINTSLTKLDPTDTAVENNNDNVASPTALDGSTDISETGHQSNEVAGTYSFIGAEIEENIAGEILIPRTMDKDFSYPRQISLETFDYLPRTATMKFDQVLQPYTNVYFANYKGKSAGFSHYYLGLLWAQSKLTSSEWVDRFPYRVQVDNVYVIVRLVLTILILSENVVEYIPAIGQPVRVDSLIDYGVSSVGYLNPTFLEAGGGFKKETFNLLAWLTGFLDQLIWILIAVAVIIVTVAILRSRKSKQQKIVLGEQKKDRIKL